MCNSKSHPDLGLRLFLLAASPPVCQGCVMENMCHRGAWHGLWFLFPHFLDSPRAVRWVSRVLGDHLVGNVPPDTGQCQESSQAPELWPAVGHGAEVSAQEVHVSFFPTEGYFQVSKAEHI